MSKMKKIAGLLLAVVMVVAMSVTALAEDNPYTITITYENSGHTYEAYQIFAGVLQYEYTVYTGTTDPGDTVYTYDATTGEYTAAVWSDSGTYYLRDSSATSPVLANIIWGSGISDGDALLKALKADTESVDDGTGSITTFETLFKDCSTAADVAEVLTGFNNDSAVAKRFAEIASEYLSSTATGTSNGSTGPDTDGNYTYTISGLDAGYYLVKDQDGSVTGEDNAYTDIILEVVANVKIGAKADTPTLDKTVTNTTDVSNVGTKQEDDTTADYDIGDEVPFTLTATLPSNYADYDTYKLNFHDTLSSGLSFIGNSVVVTVYASSTATTGTVVASGYTVTAKEGYYKVDLTAFETGMIYYTYNETSMEYEEVTDTSSGPIAGTTYYIHYTGGYHYKAVSIDAFVSGTDYYTIENGAYVKVTDTSATPDPDTTYYTRTDSDCSFDVQILDTNSLKDVNDTAIVVTKDSVIVVTYSAELNENATRVETNGAYVEFSNNPNDNGAGTTVTPRDITTVFTFTLTVDKVDSNSNPLEGAGFTLYKAEEQKGITGFTSGVTYYTLESGVMTVVDSQATFDNAKTYYVYTAVGNEELAGYKAVTFQAGESFVSGVIYYTYNNISGTYEKVNDTSATPSTSTTYYVMNEFTFDGLAVGYYKIVETMTPSGYNTMDDIYFTVTATTVESTGGTASVTSLSATVTSPAGSSVSFTAVADTKSISTTIENKSGSELPSTGGIGTTIFYVVGSILVVGAAVILITRKRMKSAR